MIVPDAVEPYVGWKALLDSDHYYLYSPQQGVRWPHKQQLEAVCRDPQAGTVWRMLRTEEALPDHPLYVIVVPEGETAWVTLGIGDVLLPAMRPGHNRWVLTRKDGAPHDAVKDDCRCGIYVSDNPTRCYDYYGPEHVLTKVAVWGRTIIADHGARGQYAYPQKFYAHHDQQDKVACLAEHYGIDWELMPASHHQEMLPLVSRFRAASPEPQPD